MNPYEDPNSARGRAQVPGPVGGYDYDYDPEPVEPAWRPAAVGSAAVGRASVGRASVPHDNGYEYDEPSGERTIGRASVPGLGYGPAVVAGRASVRPGIPVSPGAPMGPTPTGPGSGRPGGLGGPGGKKTAKGKARRSKRRNWIIASFAIFIMLAGGLVVGATYYYDDVALPSDFKIPESTTIFFNDGKSQLAKLGDVNRSIVPAEGIPVDVQHAVISAEDRKFLEHGGVDVQGIFRAAWNNVTGGETQGASTITQQYARHIADLNGITYARKIREAVLANKLEQKFKKTDILANYLNIIYFGRGAYGIEAAAQTYFSVPANKLSVEQSAVLAAVIKQTDPVPGGHQGYDPAYNEAAAKDRWGYVLDGMVQLGWLDAGKRAAMQYPKVNPYDGKSCAIDCGINQPTGNVINYVRDELAKMGLGDWKKGGYQITTSISPTLQQYAQNAAQRSVKGSLMELQPPNLMAALVAIDPTTGRVLAYYGGDNGTGTDYAGVNHEGGALTGGHSPGSSFKLYTLAAGMEEDVGLGSYWDATKVKDGPFTISNAGRTPACAKSCTLEYSALQSYNVPFYWLTKEIGPAKVVDAARKAGVKTMWNDAGEAFDLASKPAAQLAPAVFNTQVGFGQYKITVLDHANGVATFAARGVYRPAHFVVEVKHKNDKGQFVKVGGEQVKPQQVFHADKVDDIVSVLSNYPGKTLEGGRPSGRKTGTWQLGQTAENKDAWMVGFTPQIATAVWVGNVGKELPIKDKNGNRIQGATLPTDIWKKFMDAAQKGLKVEKFPERKNTGDDSWPKANGVSPTPSLPGGQPCMIPIICPPPGGGGGGGGGPAPNPTPSRRR